LIPRRSIRRGVDSDSQTSLPQDSMVRVLLVAVLLAAIADISAALPVRSGGPATTISDDTGLPVHVVATEGARAPPLQTAPQHSAGAALRRSMQKCVGVMLARARCASAAIPHGSLHSAVWGSKNATHYEDPYTSVRPGTPGCRMLTPRWRQAGHAPSPWYRLMCLEVRSAGLPGGGGEHHYRGCAPRHAP